jgi:hypothetical protein
MNWARTLVQNRSPAAAPPGASVAADPPKAKTRAKCRRETGSDMW